ncbi:MAG: hypothetical protein KJ792_06625 [Actinobacteria bacterium]|nr:hypothetical protein [Actinomycetota bacterium]
MTQNPTSAGRVVVKRKGRDHSMSGAEYSALLDRVAAKVKARRNGSVLSAEEQKLAARAGWDTPPADLDRPRTAEADLMARAGWAD